MKIKRFKVERMEYICETNHPIIARFVILSRMHKLIKCIKLKPIINGKDFGKPMYRLCIPKIRYVKGGTL